MESDDAGVLAASAEAAVILGLIRLGYIEEDPHGRTDLQLTIRATELLPQRKEDLCPEQGTASTGKTESPGTLNGHDRSE